MLHSYAAAIHSDHEEARNKHLRNELLREFYTFRPNSSTSGPDAGDTVRGYYAFGSLTTDVGLIANLAGRSTSGLVGRGVGFAWNMVDGFLGMYEGYRDMKYAMSDAKRSNKEKFVKGLSGAYIGGQLLGAQGVSTATAFGYFAGAGTAGLATSTAAAPIAFAVCMLYAFCCSVRDIHVAKKKEDMEYLAYDRLLKHYNLQQKINGLDSGKDKDEIERLKAKQAVLKNQAVAIFENNKKNNEFGNRYQIPGYANGLLDYLHEGIIEHNPFTNPSDNSKKLYTHLQQKQAAKVEEANISAYEWGMATIGMTAVAAAVFIACLGGPLAMPVALGLGILGAVINTIVSAVKIGRIYAKYAGSKKGIEREKQRLINDFPDENLLDFCDENHMPSDLKNAMNTVKQNYKARLYYAMQVSNISVSNTGEHAKKKREDFYEQFKKLAPKHRNELLDSMLNRAAEDTIIRQELKVDDKFNIDANISEKNRHVIISDYGYHHHSFWAKAKQGVKKCLDTGEAHTARVTPHPA